MTQYTRYIRLLLALLMLAGVTLMPRHSDAQGDEGELVNGPTFVRFHPIDNIIGATNGIVFETYTTEFEFISQLTLLEDPPHLPNLFYFQWSPDGSKLGIVISGVQIETGRVLQIWDTATEKKLYEIIGIDVFPGIVWSPDGTRFAALSIINRVTFVVHIFDTQTGQIITEIPSWHFSQLAWSPDGNQLVFEGYNDVLVWSAESGELLRSWSATVYPEIELAFSPTENHVAFVNLRSEHSVIEIWDADTGQMVQQLQGHTEPITNFAWSAGGLVSTSFDNTIRIWDVQTGQATTVIQAGLYPHAELNADGTLLLVRDEETGIHTRDASTGEILSIVDSNQMSSANDGSNPTGTDSNESESDTPND